MDEVLVLEQVLDEQQALAALKTLGGSNGVASQYGSRLRPHRSGSHLCAATVRGAVSMGDTSNTRLNGAPLVGVQGRLLRMPRMLRGRTTEKYETAIFFKRR